MIIIIIIDSCCCLLKIVSQTHSCPSKSGKLLLYPVILLLGLSLYAINNELCSHVRTDGNVNTMLQIMEERASRKSAREFIHFIHLAVFRAQSAISSSKGLCFFS